MIVTVLSIFTLDKKKLFDIAFLKGQYHEKKVVFCGKSIDPNLLLLPDSFLNFLKHCTIFNDVLKL